MIQPYPETTQAHWSDRPPVPDSVRNAARLMYAGSAITLIHAVVYLVTKSATKTAIHDKHPGMSAGTLNTVTNAGVTIGAVVAVIGAAAFVWIARSCLRGKNWARITGTVFFVLAIVGTVYDVSNGEAAANMIFAIVVAACGLFSVALLWLRSSSAWFRFFRRPEL